MDDTPFKHESMIRGLFIGFGFAAIEQRPASGKTILRPVPVADRRLTELPAKKHHFRSQHARKVNEPLLHTFADATVMVDLFHPAFDFVHELSNFGILLKPVHQVRCRWIELLLANDGFAFDLESPNIFQDSFNQWTHRGQQSIGFVHRK